MKGIRFDWLPTANRTRGVARHFYCQLPRRRRAGRRLLANTLLLAPTLA